HSTVPWPRHRCPGAPGRQAKESPGGLYVRSLMEWKSKPEPPKVPAGRLRCRHPRDVAGHPNDFRTSGQEFTIAVQTSGRPRDREARRRTAEIQKEPVMEGLFPCRAFVDFGPNSLGPGSEPAPLESIAAGRIAILRARLREQC